MARPTVAKPDSKTPAHRLESPDGRLAIDYVWRDDRFVHRVLVDNQPCLISLDGDGRDAWPGSPPIQDLSLQWVQGRPMLLGVGAAGSGHWSLSVGWRDDPRTEPDTWRQAAIAGHTGQPENRRAAGRFYFDIACRTKQTPYFLGSTYRHRFGQDQPLSIQGDHDAAVTVTPNLDHPEGSPGRTGDSSRTIITASVDRSDQTHRWAYWVGMAAVI